MGDRVRLVLSGAQHDEGTGFDGLYTMILCQLLQFGVFGAGVEDDPAGVEG